MSLDALKQDLERKTFRPLYYFYGEEPYLKRFYLKSLISAMLPDNQDTDLHRYEGKKVDLDTFSEELWLCPLGERKILLISDLPMSSPVAEFLASQDCDIPEDTSIIICQDIEEPDARSKTYKALKSKISDVGLMLKIQIVDDRTLSRWVAQQFQRRGCSISPEQVDYFLSVEERNMELMLSEIDKIASYCHGEVTRTALEKLCVKTVQARAYELNDYLLKKQPDKVFEVLNDLRALRTPPQKILGSLYACFGGLYKLKLTEGQPESVRAEISEFKEFLVRRYSQILSKIPLESLERLMDVCAEIDVLSKSSAVDADLLVVRLLTEAMEVL